MSAEQKEIIILRNSRRIKAGEKQSGAEYI